MAIVTEISLRTPGQGLHEITDRVARLVAESSTDNGLCTVFLRHTSASLIIQENADPSAQHDLERWINRIVPENDPHYTHTSEGADDMPSHIKAVLTAASLSIPILNNRLTLGTWQGIYLWEHRRSPHTRRLVVHIS